MCYNILQEKSLDIPLVILRILSQGDGVAGS